jgi:thiol:disulfide interchange protein DsbC
MTSNSAATRPLRRLNHGLAAGLLATMAALALGLTPPSAHADEAQIRKNLPARLTKLPPIDEVAKTPIPGIYEVRIGNDVLYTDEAGDHLIEGSLIDIRTRRNLTESRVDALTAFDFAKLPLKDTIVWKSGTGARRLVVFADPNCGYCKRLEAEMRQLKNVTIHTFLIPVLGPDSIEKSRALWCAKDRTAAWTAWMLNGQPPSRADDKCDAGAIERNAALAQRHRVNGTPALVFADNSRVAGAIGLDEIEKRLVAAAKP